MRSAMVIPAILAFFFNTCFITIRGEMLEDLKLSAKEVEQPLKVMLQTEEAKTRLRVDLNYGCGLPACTNNVTVANITVPHDAGEDNNDDPRDHHWTWSVIGRPTIQAALTSVQDDLRVDWSRLFMRRDISYSLSYSSRPDYSSALMLATLIEHDISVNRTGEDEDAYRVNSTRAYPVIHFSWRRNILENTANRVAFQFIGENFTAPEHNTYGDFGIPIGNITAGKINLTLAAYSDFGYGAWLPHLSHSESTNQMDIQLDGIQTNSGFNRSRFSLEFYFASYADDTLVHPIRQFTKTLDDEHTPGIFITQELVLPGYNSTLQSYLQWRPVVYTSPDRDLAHSTAINISSVSRVTQPAAVLNDSILFAMYGLDLEDMLVRRIRVSLGQPDDGGYQKSNYQAWTFTFGTGNPIHNGISPFVLLAFTALIGSTIVICVTAAVLHLFRKFRAAKRAAREREEQQQRGGRGYVRLHQDT